jgi:hypothetical protein
MKKTLILAAVVGCTMLAYTAQAQYKAFVSGNVGGSLTSLNSDLKTSAIVFSPTVGYSINEKHQVAASLIYQRSSISGLLQEQIMKNTVAELFVRRMFVVAPKLNFYAQTGVSCNIDAITVGIYATPGLLYQVSPRWAVNTNLGRASITKGISGGFQDFFSAELWASTGLGFGLNYCFDFKKNK